MRSLKRVHKPAIKYPSFWATHWATFWASFAAVWARGPVALNARRAGRRLSLSSNRFESKQKEERRKIFWRRSFIFRTYFFFILVIKTKLDNFEKTEKRATSRHRPRGQGLDLIIKKIRLEDVSSSRIPHFPSFCFLSKFFAFFVVVVVNRVFLCFAFHSHLLLLLWPSFGTVSASSKRRFSPLSTLPLSPLSPTS